MATLTDKFVQGLKLAAKLYEERDLGCPGLVLRVGQRGLKVWVEFALASEHKSAPAIRSVGFRVHDLWEMYQAEVEPKRRGFEDVEKVWRKWAEPMVGNVRLEDINMKHGAALIAHVVKRSSPIRARTVVRYISPMFRFAAGRGLIPENPWAGLHRPEGVDPRVSRRCNMVSCW